MTHQDGSQGEADGDLESWEDRTGVGLPDRVQGAQFNFQMNSVSILGYISQRLLGMY